MEKIIHFTVPANITPLQKECIARARELHPTWEIKVWQDPIDPEGYRLAGYWPKVNSGAQFSDLIRLDVIYRWGGVYVDGDMRLLKPLDALVENYDVVCASETGDSLEGALIGARRGHPLIGTIIADLLLNEPDWGLPPDRTTGPDIFARVAREHAEVTVLPRETFYSYGPTETDGRKTHRHSYGEHLWIYSWRELNDPPPQRPRRLSSLIKGLLRPAITIGFRAWHRIKGLDQWAPDTSIFLQRPTSYLAHGELVVKTVHGFNVVVDGTDNCHAPRVIFGDRTDLRDELLFKELLHGGDWVVDVGSPTASFSMLAGQRVGRFGRVFCYQESRENAAILARSALVNGMADRVIVRQSSDPSIIVDLPFAATPLADTRHISRTANTGACAGTISLDREFPVDLPIKIMKVNALDTGADVLKSAQRLFRCRCIDFLVIELLRDAVGYRWRRELGGVRLRELLTQLNWLTDCGYAACSVAKNGRLLQHKSVTAALDKLEGRHIIFCARDQYTAADNKNTA